MEEHLLKYFNSMGHNDFNNNASKTLMRNQIEMNLKRKNATRDELQIATVLLFIYYIAWRSLRVELNACDLQFYRS